MGLLSAQLLGPAVPPAIRWKIQGGAAPQDSVDSPLNASGLYGERHGWYRTTFDDASWPVVRVPDDWASRGVQFQGVGWYRTTFDLNLPAGVDAPLGLYIPHAQDKVVIWLNGLLIGRYWEGVGPQHVFYLPAGLLREHGRNTLALAVWNRGHHGGLTGGVSLQPYAVNAQVTLRVGG
jgi:beta-galactosidase